MISGEFIAKFESIKQSLRYRSPAGCCCVLGVASGQITNNDLKSAYRTAFLLSHVSCKLYIDMLKHLEIFERAFILNLYWCKKCNVFYTHKKCPICANGSILVPEKKSDLFAHALSI